MKYSYCILDSIKIMCRSCKFLNYSIVLVLFIVLGIIVSVHYPVFIL